MQKHDKVLANHRIEREELRREAIKHAGDLKAANQKIEQLSAENVNRLAALERAEERVALHQQELASQGLKMNKVPRIRATPCSNYHELLTRFATDACRNKEVGSRAGGGTRTRCVSGET